VTLPLCICNRGAQAAFGPPKLPADRLIAGQQKLCKPDPVHHPSTRYSPYKLSVALAALNCSSCLPSRRTASPLVLAVYPDSSPRCRRSTRTPQSTMSLLSAGVQGALALVGEQVPCTGKKSLSSNAPAVSEELAYIPSRPQNPACSRYKWSECNGFVGQCRMCPQEDYVEHGRHGRTSP
jgi:hypothetical protein